MNLLVYIGDNYTENCSIFFLIKCILKKWGGEMHILTFVFVTLNLPVNIYTNTKLGFYI